MKIVTGYPSPLVLSLDIGTSSVRSQVFNASGRAVPGVGAQIPYSMTYTADGGAFIDPDELCELVYQTIDHAASSARRQELSIAAVSCCTFWHNVVGVTERGVPCTPLLSWNDTRPESILPELAQKLDPQEFTRLSGCPMHASYLPAKISWLHRVLPERAKQVRYWMSIGEYLFNRITGRRACSYSMASATGLLDSARRQWDETTLGAIPATLDQLSPLRDARDGVKSLQPPFAQRWPSLVDAIWYPALGDGACSNIGCGCASPERVAVMVGTSGAMRVVWRGEFREPPEGLWCYRIDGERPIQGGALSNGGNLMDWLRETLDFSKNSVSKDQPNALHEIDAQIAQLPPDGHGLTFLPFLAGQRSPRWNPHSTGTLHGLRLSTQPIHILQAGLEAVAYRFRLIYDLLTRVLPSEHVIVATGGGLLHSNVWTQILSDVLGRDVLISTVAEASCRGAALMALESLGAIPDIAQAEFLVGDKISPRPEAQAIYQSALQRHVDLEFQMRG
jgi:gluconokinase